MAGSTTLDRGEWRTTLDQITHEHQGELVTIEVLDPSAGHQYEAERLPFSSLAYDPRDDTVIGAVGGRPPRYPVVLRHMVAHPTEVDITTEDVPEAAVRVVAPDGTATLITFYPEESGTRG
ncbi:MULTISPECIES: DUF5335 family protein [Streptomyces]|uniref:Uncharacterized protein n=1 Tax=Streptomyces demainii TaxID=588122 RepID=A0ABT9KJI7_9ACTN|nr:MULTISPECIES: DUF5335 family protein [Streptomyces]MBW8087986.1 DUF5335 family protein [Streptomyces hygroscopicus subsp. hygroscopicus]MCO8306049.1 DUF5335 domain-containing protein [Streptomyces sp. RKCA744]MDP9608593.1 hypothetical protein [Streptomyces demainii]